MHPNTGLVRNSFKQINHVFSCYFIVVMTLLVINFQCFSSFLAWVIIRVVCPAQTKAVPATRTSRPFGADRDFADTGWGVPDPHPYSDILAILNSLFLSGPIISIWSCSTSGILDAFAAFMLLRYLLLEVFGQSGASSLAWYHPDLPFVVILTSYSGSVGYSTNFVLGLLLEWEFVNYMPSFR